MNKVKYQVFVSSTYDDLKEERDQVIKAILEMGHIPVGMEMFSAADEEQWQIITRQIDDSDYYVVIVANRYGSMVKGISYTEKEYNYALKKGIPTLGFVLDKKAPWPSDRSEADSEASAKLEAFKKKVKRKPVNFWTSKQDLHGKCAVALSKTFNTQPRPGWVRSSDTLGPEVASELSRLSSLNAKLQDELAKLRRLGDTSGFAQGDDTLELRYKVYHYNKSVTILTTWNEVFSIVANFLLSISDQALLYDLLGDHFKREVFDKLPAVDPPIDFPNFKNRIGVKLLNTNEIKNQLFALGLVKITPLVSSKSAWSLTELGERQYGLMIAKRR